MRHKTQISRIEAAECISLIMGTVGQTMTMVLCVLSLKNEIMSTGVGIALDIPARLHDRMPASGMSPGGSTLSGALQPLLE